MITQLSSLFLLCIGVLIAWNEIKALLSLMSPSQIFSSQSKPSWNSHETAVKPR